MCIALYKIMHQQGDLHQQALDSEMNGLAIVGARVRARSPEHSMPRDSVYVVLRSVLGM